MTLPSTVELAGKTRGSLKKPSIKKASPMTRLFYLSFQPAQLVSFFILWMFLQKITNKAPHLARS